MHWLITRKRTTNKYKKEEKLEGMDAFDHIMETEHGIIFFPHVWHLEELHKYPSSAFITYSIYVHLYVHVRLPPPTPPSPPPPPAAVFS